MEKLTNKQEIEATRVGGFGGSDAAMIHSVAVKGIDRLSNTTKKRIAVAKNLIPYTPVNQTQAMARGHEFEAWYAHQPFAPIINTDTQGVLEKSIAKNFRTFAHADFFDNATGEVWELKCVGDTDAAIIDYQYQLQWYYMLGASDVWLVVCDSSQPFAEGVEMPVLVKRDEKVITELLSGIKLIDDTWNTINLATGDDWDTTDLLPFEESRIVQLTNYLMEIKRMEDEADRRKADVMAFMEDHNIKSIKSPDYTITYVPAGTSLTFDKKKLFADYPEIRESEYTKQSIRKPYVKVAIK